MARDTQQQVKPRSPTHSGDYRRSPSTDERPMQVLTARFSSFPDCGENADNRIRSVNIHTYISGCVYMTNVSSCCVMARIQRKVDIIYIYMYIYLMRFQYEQW